jgi:hypothetical protein
MKTFLRLLFLLVVLSLITFCNKTDNLISDESVELKSAQPITVTLPFEANFLGQITNVVFDDPECVSGGYACRAVVETSGNATHMGKVMLTFNFCTAGPPDPNIPGSIYTWAAESSVMIAANGDKLFLDIGEGYAMGGRTDNHPEYVTEYWSGTVTITGGTGRFVGASGELLLDDYTTNIDDYTHHHWTGTITMVKGKR